MRLLIFLLDFWFLRGLAFFVSLTGKSNSLESQILALIFQATAIANIADNAASSPLTNLYVALHTADPTTAGAQNASEVAYTGYARVAVARTSAGWTISGSGPTQVANAAAVNFPACTGGSATATWFSIGTAASGANEILYGGQLNSPFPISNGITPAFGAGTLVATEL